MERVFKKDAEKHPKKGFKRFYPCFNLMKRFELDSTDRKARSGILHTAHGAIETPFFMPVATKGSAKWLTQKELEETGTECIISNAFILYLKPGLEVVKKHGGLHKFIGWEKGIFTDSGGFQVLSKEFCKRLEEKGVHFLNPYTGKVSVFTPEESIRIQNGLGSDVAMCLDDVPLHGSNAKRLKESAERTTRWAERCAEAHKNKKQLLFGISQGGTNRGLRKKSTREIIDIGFDGIALGGLCIGEEKKAMIETVKLSEKEIPEALPRYLMGVGSAKEILDCISFGMDIFDSCFPARIARHGTAITSKGNLHLKNASYRFDTKPLDGNCECIVCKSHTRSYLHHLVKTREENSQKYLTLHNLFFMQNLIKRAREAIKEGKFERLKKGHS